MGERAGVSRQFLSHLEAGVQVPTKAMCDRLASALELDRDIVWILAGYAPDDIIELLQQNPQAGCATLRAVLLKSR